MCAQKAVHYSPYFFEIYKIDIPLHLWNHFCFLSFSLMEKTWKNHREKPNENNRSRVQALFLQEFIKQ